MREIILEVDYCANRDGVKANWSDLLAEPWSDLQALTP
jgi:hypothetical protein